MKNLTTNVTASALIAGAYNFDTRSTSHAAANTTAPVYYVDSAVNDGKDVDVDYTLNDEWARVVIPFTSLKSFVVTKGLNEFCFDSCANGCHVQDAGTYDIDTFMSEELNAVVKAYLETNKVGQAYVN